MDTVDLIVLISGIYSTIMGLISIIFQNIFGIFLIMGGIYLTLLVKYELEQDKKQEEFLKEIYDDIDNI